MDNPTGRKTGTGSPRYSRVNRDRVTAATVVLAAIVCGLYAPAASSRRPEIHLQLDINTAPREALAALPNIGPSRLAAIESARASAPFQSIGDLDRRVKGIGPVIAAELKPHLRFGPVPPLR